MVHLKADTTYERQTNRRRRAMARLAERTSRIATSATMAVGAAVDKLRRSGVAVIDFGAGEPDFGTPDAIKSAAHKALDAEFTKYTPVPGIGELRKAVCDRYKTDYGVEYAEAQVILTAGGKQALYNAALVLFGPGDEVITHQPYWPTIVEQVKLADATPVAVMTSPNDGFAIHADKILAAVTPKTRGIIINSPCNPTGALISEGEFRKIAEFAGKNGIWLTVDLCYERLIYDPVPHNLPKMLAACNALQSHTTSNVNSITQKAVVEALNGSQTPVKAMLDEYRVRRDNLYGWLTSDPRIKCLKPAGAFYMFPDISDAMAAGGFKTSIEFAQALLDEKRVAVTPGEAFDSPGFIRMSYATSMENLKEGSRRLVEFVQTRAGAPAAAAR